MSEKKTISQNLDVREVCHWLIVQICGWLLDWLLNTRLRMHNFNLRANYFVQDIFHIWHGMLYRFHTLLNYRFLSLQKHFLYKGQVYHDYPVWNKYSCYKTWNLNFCLILLLYLSIFPNLSNKPRQNKEALDISFCLEV